MGKKPVEIKIKYDDGTYKNIEDLLVMIIHGNAENITYKTNFKLEEYDLIKEALLYYIRDRIGSNLCKHTKNELIDACIQLEEEYIKKLEDLKE